MEDNQSNKVRVAAVGDIHVRETDHGKWTEFFKTVSNEADVLLICGDLTDTGDETEAEVLATELKSCSIPIVAVLGNHDYEKGRHKLIRQTMVAAGVHMLDGESVHVAGLGFAGVKGFGSGFDNYMLSYFGEGEMKAFVQTAVDEALLLDRALARLDAGHHGCPKIAVMHYAPVVDTVIGEPEPIFPFLGSSRLAEPLGRRNVSMAFHGHAHAGTFQGVTRDGVKIFNVARPLLLKEGFEKGYFVVEVSCHENSAAR